MISSGLRELQVVGCSVHHWSVYATTTYFQPTGENTLWPLAQHCRPSNTQSEQAEHLCGFRSKKVPVRSSWSSRSGRLVEALNWSHPGAELLNWIRKTISNWMGLECNSARFASTSSLVTSDCIYMIIQVWIFCWLITATMANALCPSEGDWLWGHQQC